MTGVVKKINASLGSSSGDDSDDAGVGDGSGDDAYMTILALGSYRVKGKISETNVWQINEGDPVIIRSRVDDTTWKGSIEQVKTDTNADADSQNSDDLDYDLGDSGGESASNYNFFVKLDDDTGLMMGQHVLIEIDKGQDDEKTGIWLNSAYLHIDGDNYYVWLSSKKDRLNLRKVEVGEYNEELDEYEILSGLALTDFIAADSEELHENMKTTKVNNEENSTESYDDGEENDDSLYDENYDKEEGNDDFMFEDESNSNSDDTIVIDDDGQGLGPDDVGEPGNSDKNSL
jgi:HlyD family secretion protein